MSEKEIKTLTATGCVDIERENKILKEINEDLVKFYEEEQRRIERENEILKEINEDLVKTIKKQKKVIDRLEFIRKRAKQGASQNEIYKMANYFIDDYLLEDKEVE